MSTQNFQDWVVSTPPPTDSSFRITNTSWVAGKFGAVLLNTLSPNGVASTNDTSSFTTTYANYLIMFDNVCPATNTTTFQMTVCTTGSAFTTAGYVSMAQVVCSAVIAVDNSTSAILLTGALATTQVTSSTVYGVNGFVKFTSPSTGPARSMITGQVTYQTPGAVGTTTQAQANVSGFNDTASALTGINFLFSSGNISTGTIKIYGLK